MSFFRKLFFVIKSFLVRKDLLKTSKPKNRQISTLQNPPLSVGEPAVRLEQPEKKEISTQSENLLSDRGKAQGLPSKSRGQLIVKNILGINFTFDKDSYKKFTDEFSDDSGWEISYDDVGCYLCRIKKNGYSEYFHRWLMMDQIEEFARKKSIPTKDVIVHHVNHEHTDNRLFNLILTTREAHHDYHKKEKAYQKWRGNRKDFEEWYFRTHRS